MISVEMVAELLQPLASQDDPVYRGGIETTPSSLACGEHANKDARKFYVTFYADNPIRLVRRPLLSMVYDRLRHY